ncbi:dysbindin domain-containing protein 2 isoform X2 [Tachyglossus aculeatus]|uniref:dysbindin domain-containing protein 2 isoform X2 n=1 Tax=Tachyglossus aculeatus TaxID=9261 RepID=UPI0018F63DA7|nr:dysbindin domain-containing protein 2 isoform X2 [Tachyglossus aculeatus]
MTSDSKARALSIEPRCFSMSFCHLPGAAMDPSPRTGLDRQQLHLRDRQKFFEEIFQPETDIFPVPHLHFESHRPPIGSISSMEVNVDALEQVDLTDLGEQDALDVFLPCEEPLTPHSPGVESPPGEPRQQSAPADRSKPRTSSSSSSTSTEPNSPDVSDSGAETPLAQSDEEDAGEEPVAHS